MDIWQSLQYTLRLRFHYFFFLSIILNLEFHILAKNICAGVQRRNEDPIINDIDFLQNLSKLE